MIYQDELVGLIEAAKEEYLDYLDELDGYYQENPACLTEEQYVRQILSSLYADIREQARGILELTSEVA